MGIWRNIWMYDRFNWMYDVYTRMYDGYIGVFVDEIWLFGCMVDACWL